MPFPWAIALAVASLVATSLQTYAQIRKAKKLQREASELDIREAIDDSGANIPSTYGTTVVRGLQCYIQIGDGITQLVTDRLNASGLKFGSLERSTDQDRQEYLMQQWVLSVGGTRGIKTALINGTPIERSQNQDGYAGLLIGESRPDGGVSEFATVLSQSPLYPSEIDAESKFTNLAYATTLAWNRRGSRPRWGGSPRLEFIQEGRDIQVPDTAGTDGFTNTVPDDKPASNLIGALHDLLVDNPTGPQLDAATRLASANFERGYYVSQRTVQGEDTDTDPENDAAERARFQGWVAGQGIGGLLGGAGVSGLHNTEWDSGLSTRNLLRHEFNGSIPTDASWQEAIEDYLLSNAPDVTVWLGRDGRYDVSVVDSQLSAAAAATLTLDESNIELNSLRRIRSNTKTRLNTASVKFSDREQSLVRDVLIWPPRDSQQYLDWFAEDGRELGTTLDPRGITTRFHGAALARTVVRLSRRDAWELVIYGPDARRAHPGMICPLTHPKAPANTYVRLERVKGAGRRSVQCVGREFDPADFAWPYENIDDAEQTDATGITTIDDGGMLPPAYLTLAYVSEGRANGTLRSKPAALAWDPAAGTLTDAEGWQLLEDALQAYDPERDLLVSMRSLARASQTAATTFNPADWNSPRVGDYHALRRDLFTRATEPPQKLPTRDAHDA